MKGYNIEYRDGKPNSLYCNSFKVKFAMLFAEFMLLNIVFYTRTNLFIPFFSPTKKEDVYLYK